jgi:hypothetical protein
MSDANTPNPSPTSPNTPGPEVIREFPDRGTQWLLEDPVHMRDLLQLLQPELAQRLVVSRAERLNRTMIPPDLRKKETDLIFRVPYRANSAGEATSDKAPNANREWEVLVYVLLEHQSAHDPLMMLRLFLYMAELWSIQRRQAEEIGLADGQLRIYPVIPVVFYTGADGWPTALNLEHLMDLPAELQRFAPHWDTLFLNLHRTPTATLTQFSTAVGYALQVFQAEDRPLSELEAVIQEALTGLEGLSEEQSGQWERMAWFILLLAFHRRERWEYNVLADEILGRTRVSKFAERTEAKQMGQTMAEYVKAEGIEIGEKRGIEIGKAGAMRQALLTLLATRFGQLPSNVIQAIEAAPTELMESWFTAAITAVSLEAVGIRANP